MAVGFFMCVMGFGARNRDVSIHGKLSIDIVDFDALWLCAFMNHTKTDDMLTK